MEKNFICSYYRKLPPNMYRGTVYPSGQKETMRVEEIQETGSSTVSMQSSQQYISSYNRTKFNSSEVVCRHCRRSYLMSEYTQTFRCCECGRITSVQQQQENLASGIGTYSRKGHVEPIIDPISTWEVNCGKRALLCGVTYSKEEKFKLRGTIYDVMNMRDLLLDHFKFPSSSVRILAESEGYHHPTKSNIQAALRWLVKDCHSGDSLVFYFSGHGLQQPDFDGDEVDQLDEALCPLDFKTAGVIIDNEINDTIVRPLKMGVMLHAIVDASHSGTILDLSYVYRTKDKIWRVSFPPSACYKGTSGGLAISLAACDDNQLAYDTSAFSESRNQIQGVMTSAFVKAVRENPGITYSDLLASIIKTIADTRNQRRTIRQLFTRDLKRQEQQEILLSSSVEFDVNRKFRL